ncbi:MAG: isocitrate dehydrogenase (NADP(+)) [Oligoflexia bacterium]|nr:isocitrate dehydrogenase (NADP(+)) [Oligoflexia bacterium]
MEKITIKNGRLNVPDFPAIPFITGDGIGSDITPAMIRIVDAAVEKIYGSGKKIAWKEVPAGKKAFAETGSYLPEQTLEDLRKYVISIKGPLETPVAGGIRSLNVAIRQALDLYACVRPVRYFRGVPAPVREPELLDVVIFRENTEDVYSGIEWEAGSKQVASIIEYLRQKHDISIADNSGIGIKNISEAASKRLVRKAIEYAIGNNRKSVTLVHKGNIMKYTEGAFLRWGYEIAKREFASDVITEKEASGNTEGRIIIKDRIADNMLQQLLLNPSAYDVIATPNLNGDYISDLCAAQVGGLGIAPGANMGSDAAVFEATHGTAPELEGKDKANPCSLVLSAVLMLEYMSWIEPAKLITAAVENTIQGGNLTSDFAGEVKGARIVGTAEFADMVIKNII